MAKIKPFERTLVRFGMNRPKSFLSTGQIKDLCVDELVYHINSVNNGYCKVYYDDKGQGVDPMMVSYLMELQHELSQRFLKSSLKDASLSYVW